MTDADYARVKAELARASFSTRPIWWTLAACLAAIALPVPIGFKVMPGIVVVAIFMCAGPLIILSAGGCGCGHPACKRCEFCRMTPEEHERHQRRIDNRT